MKTKLICLRNKYLLITVAGIQSILNSDLASWGSQRLPVHSRIIDILDSRIKCDQSVVLFGAMNGRRYGDNSRYVYEWILKNRKDIEPIWMTLNPDVKSRLEKENKPVRMAASINGVKLLYEAGAAMITNNLYDIALHPLFVPSSLPLIRLGHGVPVKKSAKTINRNESFEFAQKQKREELTTYVNYPPEFLINDKPKKSVVLGYPRNDPLLDPTEDARQRWIEYNSGSESLSTILYAPTWRHGREPTKFFPFEKFCPDALDNVLRQADTQLLLRPHRNELRMYDSLRTELDNYATQCERVRLATHDEFPDANALLPFVDCLITDYSGIYHDFLLLDRPILFVPYDYEDYEHHNGFRYDYFEHLPGPAIDNFEEFTIALEQAVEDDSYYRAEHKALKQKIHHYDDGESSRRVVELLDELLVDK